MTPGDWTELLKQGGIATGPVIFIIGLLRRWWVMIGQYDAMVESYEARLSDLRNERDEFRTIASSGVQLGEQTVEQITRRRGRV